jgi:hypothetical protein
MTSDQSPNMNRSSGPIPTPTATPARASASASATGATAGAETSASREVRVPLGAPVHAHVLRYTAMFDEKPFPEALLIYFDNGSYKIVSPGEDHYGSYISATLMSEPQRQVSFISWPSDDWGRNVASHTLTFNPATGAFIQALILPGEPVARAQYGFALPVPEPRDIDPALTWADATERYRDLFDNLRALASQ